VTQGNKVETKSSLASAPAGSRELSVAGVLALLSMWLVFGVVCSIVYHAASNAMHGGWNWEITKPGVDTASGDSSDGEALTTFNKVDLAELDDSLHLLSATQAMLKMDYGQALAELEQISPAYRKTDSGCRALEVECRLSLKQSDQVIEIASNVIAQNPQDYAGWLWRAQAYEQLKQYEKAIADYKKSLAAFPYSKKTMSAQMPLAFVEKVEQAMAGLVLRRMGACYERMGNFKEATAQYTEAIKKTAPQLAARVAQRTSEPLAKTQKTLKDLDAAIALRPDSNYYFMRARAYRTLGKSQEALADYNRVKLADAPSELFLERASVASALADYKSAAHDLRKAHVDDPLYEMAHIRQRKYSYAVMPMTSMKKSKVLNRLDKLIQQNPENMDNYLHRGVIQMAFHQYDEAARDLEQYLSGKAGIKTIVVAKANIYLAICRGLRKRKTEYDILLTQSAENFSNFKWWQAIMLYLDGKGVSDKVLLDSAKHEKFRLVQAHYYVGQRLAIAGFPEKAAEQFKAGIAAGAKVDEYYLCKLALIPDPETTSDQK